MADALGVIGLVGTLLGLVATIWSVVRAANARRAEQAALTRVGRQRLVLALVRIEHSVQAFQWARQFELEPLFLARTHDWQRAASEVRALLTYVKPDHETRLRTALNRLSTVLDLLREDLTSSPGGQLSERTSTAAVPLDRVVELAVETRVMMESMEVG